MDLLGRYLQAVKFWLPKGQQEDILAELAEDIRSQVEEAESRAGHKLSDEEMAALLKKRGRPMLVAMRYRPQRYLIGPGLFPMYWFVLRISLLCYLVPWTLAGLVLLASGTSHSAGQVIGSFWGSLWTALGLQFSIITIVFAAIEHYHASSGLLENWNPSALPAIRPAKDPYRISRAGSAAEIIFNLIFLGWWIVMPQGFPFSWGLEKAGIHWVWGPVWEDFHRGFFIQVILLSLIGTSLSFTNLLRPYWTRLKLAIRAAINAAVAVICFFSVRAHWAGIKAQWLLLTGPNHPAPTPEGAANWINFGVYLVLAIAVVASAVQCLEELVKIARWKGQRGSLKLGASALMTLMMLWAGAATADRAGELRALPLSVLASGNSWQETWVLEHVTAEGRTLWFVADAFARCGVHVSIDLRLDSEAGSCARGLLSKLNWLV